MDTLYRDVKPKRWNKDGDSARYGVWFRLWNAVAHTIAFFGDEM